MVGRLCTRCNETKPISRFGKNPKMADGYLNQCKDCRRAWEVDYRKVAREKIRSYQRLWENTPVNRKKAAKRLREWKKAFPAKRFAQNMLNNAIRDGKVVKWPVCAIPECSRAPHAHHPDYEQPLSVVWLCPGHHMQAHRLVG